jgi:hypothetical protein
VSDVNQPPPTIPLWILCAAAVGALSLMLVPAEHWRRPLTDASYRGFDRGLIYVDGLVNVSPERMVLTAVPGSSAVVHLVASPLSFKAQMDVQVLRSGAGATPFAVGFWTPRDGSGYWLEFGQPSPGLISTRIVRGGRFDVKILATYDPGQTYRVSMERDRWGERLAGTVTNLERPPVGENMLVLRGGPANPRYRPIVSGLVPVMAESAYVFGGHVKPLSGGTAFEMTVLWLDGRHEIVARSGGWRDLPPSDTWTDVRLQATAPAGATFGQLVLGSGNGGTTMLYSGLHFAARSRPRANLLSNGDFHRGAQGWYRGFSAQGERLRDIQIVSTVSRPVTFALAPKDAPELFKYSRLSLSLSAWSEGEFSQARVSRYELTLPSQRWYAAKTTDIIPRLLALSLLLVCAGLIVWGAAVARRSGASLALRAVSREFWRRGPWPILITPRVITVFSILVLYVLVNVWLFGIGRMPFDMEAEKTWAYVALRYGIHQLYHLPNIVPNSRALPQGMPLDESAFPYEVLMAYVPLAAGWLYRAFLAGGPPVRDAYSLEFAIKLINLVFTLGTAGLAYKIALLTGLPRRSALAVAALLLLSPVLWFTGSVWGETETVVLFLLLASIWFAERRRPDGAWIALVVAALTKQPVLFGAAVIAAAYLVKFRSGDTAAGVSWGIVVAFVLMLPLLLALSPSLPVDVLMREFGGRVLSAPAGVDAGLAPMAHDFFTFWPIVTGAASGARGVERIYFPKDSPLLYGLNYGTAGELLGVGLLIGVLALVVRYRRQLSQPGLYLPFAALSALGVPLVRSETVSRHLIYGYVLLILSRKYVSGRVYWTTVGVLTLTLSVALYVSVANAIYALPGIASVLHPANNALSRILVALYRDDRFITLASAANVLVVVLLAGAAVHRVRGTSAAS